MTTLVGLVPLERSGHEIILTLFYQYQPTIKLTSETWEYVLAAYVNLGRINRHKD